MSTMRFETSLFTIHTWTILLLPLEVSKQLPSRNIAMVKGTINNFPFEGVLEPDGNGSHWLDVDKALQANAHIKPGDTVSVSLEPTKEWIEPTIPSDVTQALKTHKQANETWQKVTPMARWEWLRWIRATNNTETRSRRIEVACSKLQSGMRRPCCFNTSACTVTEVSRNGALIVPTLQM